MIYFRLGADSAYDGDDVQSNLAIDAAILDIVVHRTLQALQLLVVDSLLGVAKEAAAAGLDFDEHDGSVFVGGYDVDVTVS